MKKWVERSVMMTTAAALHVSTTNAAFAQSGDAFGPITRAIQMVIDFVNGPFGTSAAVLVLMALGLLSFVGRISWMWFFSYLLGMGLVFGAEQIVATLQGGVQ